MIEKKKKQLTVSKMKQKAWEQFSIFIRTRNSHDGTNMCVTCLRELPIKKLHAGHFISGRKNSILFSEESCWPQCYVCNCIKSGDWPNYYRFMDKKFGNEKIQELIKLSSQTLQLRYKDFEEIYLKYKQLNKLNNAS